LPPLIDGRPLTKVVTFPAVVTSAMAPEGFTHCGCEPSLHPGGTVLRPASLTSRVPSGPRVSLRGWLSPEATTWKAGGPGSELAVVAAALEALWMPLADAIGAGSVALRVATKTMARATFRWERRTRREHIELRLGGFGGRELRAAKYYPLGPSVAKSASQP
jgi:hypothetical protein